MAVSRRHLLRGFAGVAAASVLAGPATVLRAQSGREVVDAAGRRVVVQPPVRRVWPAGPPASVLLAAAAPSALIGWASPLPPAAEAMLDASLATLPVVGRLTGSGSAGAEQVRAARPDLIVDYGTVDDRYARLADRVQAETGVPYLLLDGRLDQAGRVIALLGELVEPSRASGLTALVERVLADVDRRLAGQASERPAVYYAHGGDGLSTFSTDSAGFEVLSRAGARNAAADLPPGGTRGLGVEQIARFAPDFVVCDDEQLAATIRGDGRWQAVAAVRAGRVLAPPAGPFGWLGTPPSINRLFGVRWLARSLHPARFAGPVDPPGAELFDGLFPLRTGAPGRAELAAALG